MVFTSKARALARTELRPKPCPISTFRNPKSSRTGRSPSRWVLADEMFQTQGSGSFTAHQDLIRGGTCIEACGAPSSKTESLVDNPTYWPWGCDAHKTVRTYIIDVDGQVDGGGPFPCTNKFPIKSAGYVTLRDVLDAAGVSWKYYTPCFSAKQSGCSPSSDCTTGQDNCNGNLLDAFDVIYPVRYGAEWGSNVSWPETNIFSDIKKGALPAVSWVIPEDDENDHPGEAHDDGPHGLRASSTQSARARIGNRVRLSSSGTIGVVSTTTRRRRSIRTCKAALASASL